jgi:hypothetical protein
VNTEPRFPTRFNEHGRALNDLGWGFTYPIDIVKLGFTLWQASKYATIPNPEELLDLDPEWMTDLFLMKRLVDFQKPDESDA